MRDAAYRPDDRFWSKVDRRKDSECWPWRASITKWGYGQFKPGNQPGPVPAHRVAWMLATGREVPAGMCVCHRCDNKACCNPDHLFIGTYSDNARDLVAKGKDPWSKLDAETRETIQAEYETGVFTTRTLGAKYGVHHSTISRLVSGRSYRPFVEVAR